MSSRFLRLASQLAARGESCRAGHGISLLARFIVDKINSIFGWLRGVMSSMRIEGAWAPGAWHQNIYRSSLRLRVLVQPRTASGS